MTLRPLAAFLSSVLMLPALAQDGSAVTGKIDAMYPKLDAIYKDLHAHPELAFQEVRTAAKLAAEMRAIGFEVTEKVGKTGIVAIYKNGSGPTVLVRTEMDGLPMEEKSGFDYSSKAHAQLDGKDTMVAHSCGHDVHMTAWLATARTLVALKSQWQGTLMFIGQPAEEIVSGAKAMIGDGLFTRFGKPDYAFALHSWPHAYGTIGYNSGPVSSNSDAIEITFKGRGGHGSAPDKAVDPVMIAARFVVDVQTVISREKDPKEFGVVTIGAINGGSVGNIIPDSVKVRGTIRSYTPQVREKILAGVRRTAIASAAMADAPAPDVELIPGGAAIINDEKLVARTEGVLKQAFGNDKVWRMPAMTASEDFSQFANAGIPAMFFFTGVYSPEAVAEAEKPGGKPIAFNHSPYYAPVPEPSIKTAARAMTLAVMNVMAK
ncbi:amidohydrolase [Duganella phyllosphaerae]|uniref:Putative hydrolase YxeP n=1 Tax=Duganella phyllosphaerae TaxID=762836 RepID=A0A1E7WCA1_9BURK|nr:amidohydrolase [Duganella phyllosphaerae]OEZ94672.1 putative hydrolase YxeP [Duganella phyllosphaerae]